MNAETHRSVSVHRVIPQTIPDALQALLRPGIAVLIGQGTETIWLAAGNPESLLERLQGAIDAVEDTPAAERAPAVVQARLSAGKFPSIFPTAADVQIEGADPAAKADDGFSLTVQPVTDGLKVRLTVEEGLLRLLGRHWAEQIDRQNAAR